MEAHQAAIIEIPEQSIEQDHRENQVQKVHDRQPVILEPRDYPEWLSPSDLPPVHLLRILPAEEMTIELFVANNMQLLLNSA